MARNQINLKELFNFGITDIRVSNFVIEYVKDFDARRAATASGFPPDEGFEIRDTEAVRNALVYIMQKKLDSVTIDAEWLLGELVDNHLIARMQGKISVSNAALNIIAKHASVDAFAAEKVEIKGHEAVREKLKRGRERVNQLKEERMEKMRNELERKIRPKLKENKDVDFF